MCTSFYISHHLSFAIKSQSLAQCGRHDPPCNDLPVPVLHNISLQEYDSWQHCFHTTVLFLFASWPSLARAALHFIQFHEHCSGCCDRFVHVVHFELWKRARNVLFTLPVRFAMTFSRRPIQPTTCTRGPTPERFFGCYLFFLQRFPPFTRCCFFTLFTLLDWFSLTCSLSPFSFSSSFFLTNFLPHFVFPHFPLSQLQVHLLNLTAIIFSFLPFASLSLYPIAFTITRQKRNNRFDTRVSSAEHNQFTPLEQ